MQQLCLQIAKHIQQQQVRTRNLTLTRQALASGENKANLVNSVPELQSLASLKEQLEVLFWSDPTEVLDKVMTLRRDPLL